MPATVPASLLGIYFKLGSLLLLCTMDAMVKALGGVYGPFQLMLFRSAVAMLPIAIIVWRAGDLKIVRSKRPWLQAVRIVAGIGSSAGFFLEHGTCAVELLRETGGRLAKLGERLAEHPRDFGKPVRAEHDQRHSQNYYQLRHSDVEHRHGTLLESVQ